jgi:pimeloyl-ACP methyl ester carboxylesterase
VTTQIINPLTLELKSWTWRDYRIPYTVQGTGQPLLLIHGFGATIGHWRQNISVLASGGYQVFALDLLGFGGADKPPLDYSLDLWQAQLHDFCQTHIGKPTVFVGNSIGGLLSLMMATQYPDLSAGTVLINAAGGLNHRPDELNFPLRIIMGTFAKLVSSDLTGRLIFNLVRTRSRIRSTLKQVYYNPEAITDELVDLLYQPSCDPGAQKVFASVLTASPGEKPADLLPHLNCPLLVLWGEEDPWTPIKGATIYQQLAADNDQVEFHPIPKAGHCPHDEKPDEVNQLILDWLESTLSSSSS